MTHAEWVQHLEINSSHSAVQIDPLFVVNQKEVLTDWIEERDQFKTKAKEMRMYILRIEMKE